MNSKKPSILYIDNDKSNLELLSMIMTNLGFEIETEYNGTRGIEIYEKTMPDLVLVDIEMPGISGYVVLRRIKKFAHDNHHKVKIFMVTSNISKEDFLMAMENGADDYLLKPFKKSALFEKMKKHFPDMIFPES